MRSARNWAARGDHKLFVLLTGGVLVVREGEFDDWYRRERRKGKWPSQKSRKKTAVGRPTKQSDALKNAVMVLVTDRAWHATDGIAKLYRLLVERAGLETLPSHDTLRRCVIQLHIETGHAALRRAVRVPR